MPPKATAPLATRSSARKNLWPPVRSPAKQSRKPPTKPMPPPIDDESDTGSADELDTLSPAIERPTAQKRRRVDRGESPSPSKRQRTTRSTAQSISSAPTAAVKKVPTDPKRGRRLRAPTPPQEPPEKEEPVVVSSPRKSTRQRAASPVPPSLPSQIASKPEEKLPTTPSPKKKRTYGKRGPWTQKAPPPSPPPAVLPAPEKEPAEFVWTDKDLTTCLDIQKRAALASLSETPLFQHQEDAPNEDTSRQLTEMLQGTIERSEGNSCLLLGPRGSGKSTILESCLRQSSNGNKKPIIIRLSGWVQQTDRQAMREISTQLREQTGTTFLSQEEAATEDDDHRSLFDEDGDAEEDALLSEPVTSQLPVLISIIPTLSRPTIIILDAFDLFALHPRQALLYCLLDTVQSIRVGVSPSGMAVIGLTSRVDTINLLEKRVKSRFSGRIFMTNYPSTLEQWIEGSRRMLCPEMSVLGDSSFNHWAGMWKDRVDSFLAHKDTVQVMQETFSVLKDYRFWIRILTSIIVQLSQREPWPTTSMLRVAAETHRVRQRLPCLNQMPYSSLCLLVASSHASTAGYPLVTFEMLYEYFREQVRASAAAPVHVNGGSIGMVSCTRDVLASAFESLIGAKVFAPAAAAGNGVAKEFVKFRCTLEREEIRKAVETSGQVTLKKWFTKG